MDDSDKAILDEVAEGAAYLMGKLMSQRFQPNDGTTGTRGISYEIAAELTAQAIPVILQARLDVIRR